MKNDPLAASSILTAGPAPAAAAATLILLHGRGSSPADILSLYTQLDAPMVAAVALGADGGTWYPHSFLAPLPSNQPWLDSSLGRIESLVQTLLAQGVAANRIVLLGFSQGACLACEFVARHPRPYGALLALTGGLIGPPETPRNYRGSLAGVPVFLGSGDPDPHVPFARVEETAATFQRMGAAVDLRRYPGLPHTVSGDEIAVCRAIVAKVAGGN